MPIVEPLLWLASTSLLIALIGMIRENIRLKRLNCFLSKRVVTMTGTEKAFE